PGHRRVGRPGGDLHRLVRATRDVATGATAPGGSHAANAARTVVRPAGLDGRRLHGAPVARLLLVRGVDSDAVRGPSHVGRPGRLDAVVLELPRTGRGPPTTARLHARPPPPPPPGPGPRRNRHALDQHRLAPPHLDPRHLDARQLDPALLARA